MRRLSTGLALAAGAAGVFLGASWAASRALARRLISAEGLGPTLAKREDLLAALAAAGATVRDFRHAGSARDPVELATIFASPGPPAGRPTILFLHGKGGNAAEWQPDALRALAQGYCVLLPELRGHAPSGGAFVTYGFLEKEDLARALDVAAERHGLEPGRLGIHSCSAGSTVALEFAAGRSDVRAVWLESPYADPHEMARHYLGVATGLPRWALGLTTRWAVRRATNRIRQELGYPSGVDASDRVDPLRSLSRVKAPVCLVSGEDDALVPPHFTARLEARLPPGSSVWRAAGAGHCHHENEPEAVLRDEYERRWREFFAVNLTAK